MFLLKLWRRWRERKRKERMLKAAKRVVSYARGLRDSLDLTTIEREYLFEVYPKIFDLAGHYHLASLTGANREARSMRETIDAAIAEAEKKLREAGVTEERQLLLEEIFHFSDLGHARVYAVSNPVAFFLERFRESVLSKHAGIQVPD